MAAGLPHPVAVNERGLTIPEIMLIGGYTGCPWR
jgi:hypothetical protein